MKKLILAMIAILSFSCVLAQNDNTNLDKFKNLKVLKSDGDEEVQVEIRKPDNSSLMTRKATTFKRIVKLDQRNKLRESNKLLY